MHSNNILNFHESTTTLNACKKKSGNLLDAPRIYKSKYNFPVLKRANEYINNFPLYHLFYLSCTLSFDKEFK